MSDAIRLTWTGTFSAPDADTPFVPDISTGLLYDFDASDLLGVIADGAPVTNWVSSKGAGAVANRTLGSLASGWSYPAFDADGGPDGGPAVLFNGTQQIGNITGTASYAQPTTLAVVCRSDSFANGTQARIVASGNNQLIAPLSEGYKAGSSSASAQLSSGVASTGWTSIIYVGNGNSSMLKVGYNSIITGPGGTLPLGAISLGAPNSALSTSGLVGAIRKVRAYSRALTQSDVEGLAAELMSIVG